MRIELTMLAAASLLLAGCGAAGDDASPATAPSATPSVPHSSTPPEDPAGRTSPESTPSETPRRETAQPSQPPEPAPTAAPSRDATTDATSPPPGDPSAGLVDDAVADLAGRLSVPAADIEVVRVKQVTWPDGSLGCPEPGKAYTQATVDGYQVILRHDDRIYLYHAGGEGPIFLCPSDDKDGGHDFVPPPGFHD